MAYHPRHNGWALIRNCIIDLPDLGGSDRPRRAGVKVHTFCAFEGD